jgi:hypothetical protein
MEDFHVSSRQVPNMALPDPIPTITVNSVAYNFARVGMDSTSSVYATPDGNDRLLISRQSKNRNRMTIRLDRRKIAANPFDASLNQEYSQSAYVVWDLPKLGVTAQEAAWHSQLLSDLLVAGTPDYGLRVLQGEV